MAGRPVARGTLELFNESTSFRGFTVMQYLIPSRAGPACRERLILMWVLYI